MEHSFLNTGAKAGIIQKLDLSQVPPGTIQRYWLYMITDGMGVPVHVPVLVARGRADGPVLGLTAAIHGNEINGIPVVQRLFQEIQVEALRGVVVGVPIVNVPAVLQHRRRFIDEADLNDVMPGREGGTVSQVYAFRIVDRVVRHFDYLLDLHTSGFGRMNAYYVRADLEDPVTRQMALLQNAPFIVHNPPSDGTLRGAADALGIHSVTMEVGNPQTFQRGLIRTGLTGIHNLMHHLDMTEGNIELPGSKPIICQKSYWFFSDTGGILTVEVNIGDYISRGNPIATLRNAFGDLIKEYFAPEDGIVIGKSVDPISQTGGRILHIGILE